MGYFAQIWTGETTEISGVIYTHNMVLDVIIIPDHQVYRGQEYLTEDLSLGGTWLETSHSIRCRLASKGMIYNEEYDIFHLKQKYASWTLNTTVGNWTPPTPRPTEGRYKWDEDTLSWVLRD